ncbi:hypothetical protein CLOM_g18373, partial [Closterium sp. NIES-68]
MLATSQPPYQ